MAGSIPPLVSSSPPPLCAFDDDEEEDEDEFGMYTATEDIEYNECVSFKEKDAGKQNGVKVRGEQDSTSQDSATDSGLCPDSESMSPTLHSDDERTVKHNTCDRLCQKPSNLLGLVPNCDSKYSECLDIPTLIHEPTACKNLPNGHSNVENSCNVTESNDKFGFFANVDVTTTSSLQVTKQGITPKESTKSDVIPSATEDFEFNNSITDIRDNHIDNDQSETVDQECYNITTEFGKTAGISHAESNLDLKDSFSSELNISDEQTLNYEEGVQKLSEDTTNLADEECIEIVLNNTNFENEDDEFDDFTDFKASFSNSLECPVTKPSEQFSEHSIPFSEQEHPEDAVKSFQLAQQDESDDEFSNFADFSSSDCVFVSAQSSNSLENISHIPFKSSDDTDLRTDCDFQDWVSVFPCDDSDTPLSDETILLKEDDPVWTRLFPLESTPALSYQWAESLANRRLLSALNIDSRNILFMPWSNSAVPRFAANLSCGPLEPVKATEPLQPVSMQIPVPQLCQAASSIQESVPEAHFDWVGSGLTNPLDCPKPVLNIAKVLSTEAGKILSSLPDLSYMRKTYIDFPIREG